MKKLLSGTVGLAGYPILSVVAVLHGIGIGFVWCVKNIVPLWPLAAASSARRWSAKLREVDKPGPFILAGFCLVFFGIVNLCGAFEYHYDVNLRQMAYGYSWWWNNSWIFLALIATNVFSIMYEIGRAYWHRNDKPAPQLEEVLKENQEADSYMDMWRKIEDLESVSKEQLKQLTEEIGKLFKADEIDMQQLRALTDHLENAFENSLRSSEDPVSD